MHYVLVVDDDVQLCRLIENSLKGEGFEIEIAHDLAASLRLEKAAAGCRDRGPGSWRGKRT